MIKEKIVIATIKSWNIINAEKFRSLHRDDYDIFIVTEKNELSYKRLKRIRSGFIFFPHWPWIIPKKVYREFQCVVFHMTDLPFGRGGSPLQNLIKCGIVNTKISAIRVNGGIDTGPVYLKRKLGLEGKASEIFKRASEVIFKDMIPYIIRNKPDPIIQKGRVVNFKRRISSESNIANLAELKKVYDHIRMLDAEGYPQAFIETKALKVEFNDAILKNGYVIANARIIKK